MANVVEANSMDEILPNLWVGDLYSARNTELLRSKNVHSVLTAMRGRVSINETFMKHQINLDDTEEADVLQHLLPSISFIQAELDKGRGVLVHCQAGMSRSATIVAAYLMYSQNIDAATAIDMIRKARPSVQPNDGFMHQLEIFHQAAFKVSRRDKAVRMFYLERAVEEILNGDGSAPETDMFAKFPRTPSDSAPATPGGPRRRIRCKMCRQELAAREHMLDHGQIGPPTPAGVLSPATSRRASMNGRPSRRPSATGSRRPSAGASVQTRPRVGSGAGSDTRPRRPSLLSFEGSVLGGMAASLSMSALETEDENDSEGVKSDSTKEKDATAARRTRTPSRGAHGSDLKPRQLSGPQNINSLGAFAAALSMSALDSEDEDSDVARPMRLTLPEPHTATKTNAEAPAAAATGEGAAASHPPPASAGTSPIADTIPEHAAVPSQPARASNGHVPSASPNGYQHPSDLAAQLYANPKLAALRGPMPLGMSPLVQPARDKASLSPPILMNPKCSGYFVEPMGWMEFFLEKGDLAGKIICPNKKCGAKLGNYDWAGVCCSCKEWVVPGFCIHRSKVDEIVV